METNTGRTTIGATGMRRHATVTGIGRGIVMGRGTGIVRGTIVRMGDITSGRITGHITGHDRLGM